MVLGLGACSSTSKSTNDAPMVTSVLRPYKFDIVQGNVVTREQVAYLKPGMPRAMVHDVLGTPLVTDPFHANRWDFVFSIKRAGGNLETRKVAVFFKDDKLDHVEADDLPSEAEFAATLKSNPPKSRLPDMEATPDQLQKFPQPKPVSASQLPSIRSDYPPLESPTK